MSKKNIILFLIKHFLLSTFRIFPSGNTSICFVLARTTAALLVRQALYSWDLVPSVWISCPVQQFFGPILLFSRLGGSLDFGSLGSYFLVCMACCPQDGGIFAYISPLPVTSSVSGPFTLWQLLSLRNRDRLSVFRFFPFSFTVGWDV